MSCGCGGECCGQQPKGLGFLWWGGDQNAAEDVYGDYDYLYDYGGNYDGDWGGWDSPGGWWDVTGGGYGLDFWGLDDASYWDYYGWNVGPSYSPGTSPGFNVDFGFLPSNPTTGTGTYGTPNDNWQGLLDWWRELTAPRVPLPGPEPNTSTLPPFSGYCPPNTYCADWPKCTQCLPLDNSRAAKAAAAAAHKAAQAAAKAAAQQRAKQQQRCPPNTGLVKNAQGQCVCPPGYAPNAQLKKCVLVNASLAAQSGQAPDWLKYALLALGAVVVVKAVKK